MEKVKNTKEFLSVKEVCEILGVSKYVVYKLLEQGELRGYRLPHKWLITRESFESFMRAIKGGVGAKQSSF